MKILINQNLIRNFDVRKGDTKFFDFEFYGNVCDSNPIDLTGWTKVFEVADNFNNIILSKNDFILLTIDTASLHPTEYRYKMTLISPISEVFTFLQGFLRIKSNLL